MLASMPFDSVARGALLAVEYDGTPFHGWSRQPDLPTVESAIRAACARIGVTVHVLRCAGRTDTGVHATAQVAELVYEGAVPPERLSAALDGQLQREVSVTWSGPLPEGFDVRGDAIARAYDYRVLTRAAHAPLRARHVLHHPRRLDRDLLDRAAAATVGRHDFTAFTKTRTSHRWFHRTVQACHWRDAAGDELVLRIEADAFLRNMVRVIVGNMLAVARGERALDDYLAQLAGGARAEGAATAQPHGLCLVRVDYPDRSFGEPRPVGLAIEPRSAAE